MKSDVTVVKELGMQGAKCPSPFPSFSANIPSCCLPQSKFPPEISFYSSTSSLGKAKQQKAYFKKKGAIEIQMRMEIASCFFLCMLSGQVFLQISNIKSV